VLLNKMTTNVFDGAVSVVATDSRWSWVVGDKLVYLDDTGFDKIQVLPDLVVMYAGRGDLVQAWRNYFAAVPRTLASQPAETKEVCVCIIDAATGQFVKSAGGVYTVFETSRFGGSGGAFACGCWMDNRDALRAVETAKHSDQSSGGEVRFVDIKGNGGNVKPLHPTNVLTIDMVNAALHKRGQVMPIAKENKILNSSVPFKMAAANDRELEVFGEKVANGELPPHAPFYGMEREWTPIEKEELNDALTRYGWK